MNLNAIEKLEQTAIETAVTLWSEGNYSAKLIGYYYFPDDDDPEDSCLIVAIKMSPPDVGCWECSYEECLDLFDSQPDCDLGKVDCEAQEIMSVVQVFEIVQDKSTLELSLGGRDWHHELDFESEYVRSDDLLDNYKISPSKIPTLNLPEFSTMSW